MDSAIPHYFTDAFHWRRTPRAAKKPRPSIAVLEEAEVLATGAVVAADKLVAPHVTRDVAKERETAGTGIAPTRGDWYRTRAPNLTAFLKGLHCTGLRYNYNSEKLSGYALADRLLYAFRKGIKQIEEYFPVVTAMRTTYMERMEAEGRLGDVHWFFFWPVHFILHHKCSYSSTQSKNPMHGLYYRSPKRLCNTQHASNS